MKLNPIEDRVIIKPNDIGGKTSGGVIIPDIGQELPTQGEVIAVGPGKMNDAGNRLSMTTKVGDVVLYPKYSAAKFEFEDVEYLIIREVDLLAILSPVEVNTLPKTKELLLD